MREPFLPVPLLMEIETEWAVLPPPPTQDDEGWHASWQHLFERYVPAMTAYVEVLIRRAPGVPRDTAPDIVTEYVTACMEKGWLSRTAADIRSFRAFLKTQLFRFTSDWLDRHLAARRTPLRESGPVPPELASEESDASLALDRAFLEVVGERALSALAKRSPDQAEIVRDLLRTEGLGSPDLAARLGRDASQMPVLRHRARRAFASLFATELKRTVADQTAYCDLLRNLETHLP